MCDVGLPTEYEDCVLPKSQGKPELAAAILDLASDPRDWPLEERPLLYMAGFYTANPAQGLANIGFWFPRALDLGWIPLVPHTSILLDMLCPQPPSMWYAYDRALLRQCPAMFVAPDPRTAESTGVADEVECAKKLDIPVLYELVSAMEVLHR